MKLSSFLFPRQHLHFTRYMEPAECVALLLSCASAHDYSAVHAALDRHTEARSAEGTEGTEGTEDAVGNLLAQTLTLVSSCSAFWDMWCALATWPPSKTRQPSLLLGQGSCGSDGTLALAAKAGHAQAVGILLQSFSKITGPGLARALDTALRADWAPVVQCFAQWACAQGSDERSCFLDWGAALRTAAHQGAAASIGVIFIHVVALPVESAVAVLQIAVHNNRADILAQVLACSGRWTRLETQAIARTLSALLVVPAARGNMVMVEQLLQWVGRRGQVVDVARRGYEAVLAAAAASNVRLLRQFFRLPTSRTLDPAAVLARWGHGRPGWPRQRASVRHAAGMVLYTARIVGREHAQAARWSFLRQAWTAAVARVARSRTQHVYRAATRRVKVQKTA